MKLLFVYTWLTLFCSGVFAAVSQEKRTSGNEGGYGGDVFEVNPNGAGYVTWDTLEYGEEFLPGTLAVYSKIKNRIDAIRKYAPHTAAVIQTAFEPSSLLWAWVDVPLKKVKPTGETKLVLTYKRVQAAISDVAGRTVQINREIWEKHLNDEQRTQLLMHEAVWFARLSEEAYIPISKDQVTGPIEITGITSEKTRKTTAYLNSSLRDLSTPENLRRFCGYLKANGGNSDLLTHYRPDPLKIKHIKPVLSDELLSLTSKDEEYQLLMENLKQYRSLREMISWENDPLTLACNTDYFELAIQPLLTTMNKIHADYLVNTDMKNKERLKKLEELFSHVNSLNKESKKLLKYESVKSDGIIVEITKPYWDGDANPHAEYGPTSGRFLFSNRKSPYETHLLYRLCSMYGFMPYHGTNSGKFAYFHGKNISGDYNHQYSMPIDKLPEVLTDEAELKRYLESAAASSQSIDEVVLTLFKRQPIEVDPYNHDYYIETLRCLPRP